MESQTRFDLNAAIENWRQELASQPNLTADDRRELETHLRDTVAELRRRGLNDDESFWLARRRTGQPQKLAAEFVKADPANVWRERGFWIAVALLVIRLWPWIGASACFAVSRSLWKFALQHPHFQLAPDWVLFYLPFLRLDVWELARLLNRPSVVLWGCYLSLLCIVILLVSCDMKLYSVLLGGSDPDQALRVSAGTPRKHALDGL